MNKQEKLNWLIDLLQHVRDGGKLEYGGPIGGWKTADYLPTFKSPIDVWRKKPEIDSVDMSVLVGSGVDCIFSDYVEPHMSLLVDIREVDGEIRYVSPTGACWSECRPRTNYWFSVKQLGGGNVASFLAERLRCAGFWVAYDNYQFPKAIMITGLQEGYCWPWEKSECSH